MSNKMLPLSVRVSLDDATFLSGYSISGAKTPSEKIRALIKQARHRQEGVHDYAEGLAVQNEEMAPFIQAVRETEVRLQAHSEFLLQLAQWLPEATAFLLANHPESSDGSSPADLERLKEVERGAAARVITLMESVLRMAITPQSPCYDDHLINDKINGVLELCQLISTLRQRKREDES